MKMNRSIVLLSMFSFLSCGCFHHEDKIHPLISSSISEKDLTSLHSPFPELGLAEQNEDWGKEWKIGHGFGKELDLYRAITAFKRAKILLPDSKDPRMLEIDYNTLLSYYLGKKYEDVIETFEKSNLSKIDRSFPVFHDLLVILYDSYEQAKEPKKAKQLLEIIKDTYPYAADNLLLSTAMKDADFCTLRTIAKTNPQRAYVKSFLSSYTHCKKSVGTAGFLNILPGAGYLYLGQKKSAFTAFILNSVFIAAAYEFFHHGLIAPGIITTSIEVGWYFGGIIGACEEAKFYNEKLYRCQAKELMQDKKLFPVFQLQYAY